MKKGKKVGEEDVHEQNCNNTEREQNFEKIDKLPNGNWPKNGRM